MSVYLIFLNKIVAVKLFEIVKFYEKILHLYKLKAFLFVMGNPRFK